MPAPPVLDYTNRPPPVVRLPLTAGYFIIHGLTTLTSLIAAFCLFVAIDEDRWGLFGAALVSGPLLLVEVFLLLFTAGHASQLNGHSRRRRVWFFVPALIAPACSAATLFIAWLYG